MYCFDYVHTPDPGTGGAGVGTGAGQLPPDGGRHPVRPHHDDERMRGKEEEGWMDRGSEGNAL